MRGKKGNYGNTAMRFRTAAAICLVAYLGTEVLISYNRPLIADRWVSEKIEVRDKGKIYLPDASMEMDVYSKGNLTDPQLNRAGYGVRFQIDGKDNNLGLLMGFPKENYTPHESGIRFRDWGLCEIDGYKSMPGLEGNLYFKMKKCPNFTVYHGMGDDLVFESYNGDRRTRVYFKRKTRLNPLALWITKWNRAEYMRNAGKFMNERPI